MVVSGHARDLHVHRAKYHLCRSAVILICAALVMVVLYLSKRIKARSTFLRSQSEEQQVYEGFICATHWSRSDKLGRVFLSINDRLNI